MVLLVPSISAIPAPKLLKNPVPSAASPEHSPKYSVIVYPVSYTHLSIFAMEQKNMFSAAPDMMKNPQLLVIFLKDVVQKEAAQFFTELLEEGVADGSVSLEYPKETAEVLMLLGKMCIRDRFSIVSAKR